MSALVEMTGKKFEDWEVIDRAECPPSFEGSTAAYWLCRCKCGSERVWSGILLRHGKGASSCASCRRKPRKCKWCKRTGAETGFRKDCANHCKGCARRVPRNGRCECGWPIKRSMETCPHCHRPIKAKATPTKRRKR